jgi:hypothetical protein
MSIGELGKKEIGAVLGKGFVNWGQGGIKKERRKIRDGAAGWMNNFVPSCFGWPNCGQR